VHSAAWRHKIRPSSSSSVRGKIPAYADFQAQPSTGSPMRHALPAPEIFKAYDIRGIVDTLLTADAVRAIGHALGTAAVTRGGTALAVGRDGRLSGPALAGALAAGIRAAGVDVIDIGCVPTPLTYFAAYQLGCDSCVSVTGSHNPPDYNGLKMVLG